MGSKTLFRLLSSMGAGASGGRGVAVDPQQSKHAGPAAGRIGIFGVPARSDLHPPDLHFKEERDPALSAKRKNRTIPLESRLRILCSMIFAPGFLLALLLFWRAKTPWPVIAATLGFLVVLFLILMGMLAEQVVRPLQTMTNVVASLREGDFSFRARGSQDPDAWGELAFEVNHLADMLQGQQLSELEATALLRNVVLAMDAPVLAFDRTNNLRLINPAAERLLNMTAEGALGRNASDLRLAQLLRQPDQDKTDQGIIAIGGKEDGARWMVRRSTFRQHGIPHTLLILSDVSKALRKQEWQAWQRLIRVLGHEINNSLTPIKSIAGTLRQHVQAKEPADGPEFDRALAIIESRADSLNRFVQAYRQLAQMPQPALRRASLRPLLERVAALETGVFVRLEPGPDLLLEMDPDQIEQLMINLIRNAAEAALARSSESKPSHAHPEAQPEVTLSWRADGAFVEILVTDNGTGLSNPSNLFVPFYTTKAGGSGVGLTLARQICEAHGGAIELTNRLDAPGCQAHVRLRL